MAIKVGQVRRSSSQSYISGISHELTTFESAGIGNSVFEDFAIRGNFVTNTTYYIRVLINRLDINKNMGDATGAGDNDPHNYNLDIKLYSGTNENSKYQTIGEPIVISPYFNEDEPSALEKETAFMKWCDACVVDGNPAINNYEGAQEYYNAMKLIYESKVNQDTGKESDIRVPYQTIELVFTPFMNAQFLVFQLRRVAYDYTVEPRVISIVGQDSGDLTQRDVAVVNNILPKSYVNKIGLQIRPGSLVVINREPMRVGKSGTLEINNGIAISSVGMVAPQNEVDEFILDYSYTA